MSLLCAIIPPALKMSKLGPQAQLIRAENFSALSAMPVFFLTCSLVGDPAGTTQENVLLDPGLGAGEGPEAEAPGQVSPWPRLGRSESSTPGVGGWQTDLIRQSGSSQLVPPNSPERSIMCPTEKTHWNEHWGPARCRGKKCRRFPLSQSPLT